MLPTSMAFCSLGGRFKTTINRLSLICYAQHVVNKKRNLSLSCQSYVIDNDNLDETTDKTYKYRKTKYKSPYDRAFQILKHDIVDYVRRKKEIYEKIKSGNIEDVKDIPDNVYSKSYGFDLSTSRGDENLWPSHCDVLVVGGGAVGSSIAYHLKEKARDGLSVVVVEQDSSYKKASTVLSVGGIRQQFSIPENIELSLYGMEFLRNSQKLLKVEGMDTPDIQFNPHGYLTLASEKGYDQLKQNYELQVEMGANVCLLSGKEISEMYPWLNNTDVVGGVLGRENEGWFDPWSLLIGLQRKSISLGAEYVNGKVTAFNSHNIDDLVVEKETKSKIKQLQSVEVTLPDGEKRNISFAILVLAGGAWTGELGKMIGVGDGTGIISIPIPIEPRKRYVYCVHAPDGPGINSPLVVDPNGTYFRREGLGGLYLCGQSPAEEDEPSVDNLNVDYDFFDNNVWPTIANRVPAFEKLKLQSSWAGFYDYNTFDQNGIIGIHPLFSNLFIASGFSGHGIQQAPGVGRAIMEFIIYSDYQTINLERFGFDRVIANCPLYESNIV